MEDNLKWPAAVKLDNIEFLTVKTLKRSVNQQLTVKLKAFS